MATIHRSQPGTSGTTKLNHQTNEAWLPVLQRQLNIAPPLDPAACLLARCPVFESNVVLGHVKTFLKQITISSLRSYSRNINLVLCVEYRQAELLRLRKDLCYKSFCRSFLTWPVITNVVKIPSVHGIGRRVAMFRRVC